MPSADEVEEPSNSELVHTILHSPMEASDAFGILFARHKGGVEAILRQMLRNQADREDMLQEVFLQAYRKLDALEDPDAFSGWIAMITRRFVYNRSTKKGSKDWQSVMLVDDLSAVGLAGSEENDPSSSLIDEERSAIARQGIQRLKKDDRDSLQAFYFNDEMLKDTSERTNLPLGTIKRRLFIARQRLAATLVHRHPEHFVD